MWRRAVVDDRGLLFCLANADVLDYDVSQQAVRSLETLTQGRHSKYGFLAIVVRHFYSTLFHPGLYNLVLIIKATEKHSIAQKCVYD